MTETTITVDVSRDDKKFTVLIRKDFDNSFCIKNLDGVIIGEKFTSVVKALEWVAEVMLATDIQPIA